MASSEFQNALTELLPMMRRWALRLTRDGAAADDLVQNVAIKALTASHTFIPGTNFSAWVRRIMFNRFISDVRCTRIFCDLSELAEQGVPARQQEHVDLRQISAEFRRLPPSYQEVLRLVAIEDRSYEQVSEKCGLSIGTVKSRVHRARSRLRAHMDGTEPRRLDQARRSSSQADRFSP